MLPIDPCGDQIDADVIADDVCGKQPSGKSHTGHLVAAQPTGKKHVLSSQKTCIQCGKHMKATRVNERCLRCDNGSFSHASD